MYGRETAAGIHVCAVAQTVDLHALHRRNPARYPFLLQSTARETRLGRYDILFGFPGDALELSAGTGLTGRVVRSQRGFLHALDDWWRSEYRAPGDSELPFTGGWFLYLGYELAAEIEPTLNMPPDSQLPTAFAVRCPAAVINDRAEGLAYLIAEAASGIDTGRMLADIGEGGRIAEYTAPNPSLTVSEEPPERFLRAVRRAKDYIAAGDIYQANLSRGWTTAAAGSLDPDRIYRALCETNPAPFAGLVRWKNTGIISSSPERLLRVRGGVVSTRPIAGTRPRSPDSGADLRLSEELVAHPKERAEHVMLIDLERNDLGRICDPGSVEVDEMMVLESYAHVHHIVSNVRGTLRAGVTPGEIIRAVFPGGTITGCPKVRCMQIISELEAVSRGAYTGSFGYLNRDGDMDLNILIRTLLARDGSVAFRAGSGIVADSEPEAELAETRAKAEGMLRALRA